MSGTVKPRLPFPTPAAPASGASRVFAGSGATQFAPHNRRPFCAVQSPLLCFSVTACTGHGRSRWGQGSGRWSAACGPWATAIKRPAALERCRPALNMLCFGLIPLHGLRRAAAARVSNSPRSGDSQGRNRRLHRLRVEFWSSVSCESDSAPFRRGRILLQAVAHVP
jgi:hypothetical protein